MINDPTFGRPNRNIYPMGPDHVINNPIEQGHNRGPSDAPNVAGTPSETTVATPRQVPPMHPDYIPDIHNPQTHPFDLRFRARPQVPGVQTPRYGVLYDSQRTRDGWDKFVDIELEGTITPAAGTVSVSIALANWQAQTVRTLMYPGATSYYLCIRSFAIAPQTTTGTGTGSYRFLDLNNNPIALGVIPLSTFGGNVNLANFIPTPYTDPTNTILGTLQVTSNAGGTFPVVNWQLAFSYVYILPVMDIPYVPVGSSDVSAETSRERKVRGA